MRVYLLKLIFITIISHQTFSFNLSPKFHIIFNVPNKSVNSYFGYSVHLRTGGVYNFPSSVVIGAPKANSTKFKNFHEPGVVYQCDIKDNPTCDQLLLTSTGSVLKGISNSWLGASIDGDTTRDGKLVSCAPRWINTAGINLDNTHPLAVGMCNLESNTRYANGPVDTLIPFRSERDNRHFVGEVGISVHIPKADGLILMGAVGIDFWKGGVVLYNTNKNNFITYYTPKHYNYYSYFGYAVSSGKIERNNEIVYFASAPRDNGYRGRVYAIHVYGSRLMMIKGTEKTFTGDQVGEYFGASICLVDVNGDGLDDVLIGAPRYSIDSVKIESGDEGAVYVYINTKNYKFQQQEKLKSQQETRAEFGTCIASLGDLDNDGFNDVVVGAPYEDEGRGAIYIYLGSAQGLNAKSSQHIRARNINDNLLGFGISVSKGVDIDGNLYHDLAVGSYKSGHVILFRSHPVIQLFGRIVPDKKELSLDTTKFTANICMKYSCKAAVPSHTTVKIVFNVDSIYQRAIIQENGNATMTKTIPLVNNTEHCLKTTVLIIAKRQDFSKPIDLELKYNVTEDQSKFCPLCPVLNPLESKQKTQFNHKIHYVTGCGTNAKCKPNLKVKASISDRIIVGSKKSVFLNISITNTEDAAFITILTINLPNLLGFVQIPENCNELEEYQIECQLDTILKLKNKTVDIELETFKITNNLTPFKINLTVISAGDEVNFDDNNFSLPLELITKSELRLFGNSSTEFIRIDPYLNNTHIVMQEYIIQNLGPSPVNEAVLEIHIPVLFDNMSLFRVHEPKGVICTANGPGFYSNTVNFDDSTTEMNDVIPVRMIRDTSNLEMEDINFELSNFTSNEKADNYHNINRTVFFNCSANLIENRIACMTVKCRVPLMDDMGTKGSIKITIEPQVENIDKILDNKDILEVEFLALSEPSIKPTISSEITTTSGRLTIIRISAAEKYPILLIILAIILGIIILGLIVSGLWKYGFFKRSTKEQLSLLQNTDTKLIETEDN